MSLDQTWPNHVYIYIYIKLVVMYLQCKQLSRFNRKIRGSGCRDIWPQVWLTCTIMIIMLFKTPTTLWTTQKTYYQQQNKHVQQYWRTLAKNIVNKPRWRVPHGSVTPWFPSDSKLSKKGDRKRRRRDGILPMGPWANVLSQRCNWLMDKRWHEHVKSEYGLGLKAMVEIIVSSQTLQVQIVNLVNHLVWN